ncbi:hypothetical protein SADUNF_Sadunf05G0186400 [Salix dunnii]|uniref:Syringolide-induced protein 14-1-1 n=1 Tax=Salix dunnii TaxID=1413687 RepID=A0A835K9G6_9ROSI|nr:hypothetical protein SADUNF_Sadunf05G0186400 [Salix dunnii]
MEKLAAASPKMILRFIPKVVSAVNFHNLTVSPGRDKRSENTHRHKAIAGKGLNPVRSLIPVAVRRRQKNENFETQEEPTSPKVSCIGQIKHKKMPNKGQIKRVSWLPQETKSVPQQTPPQVKNHASKLKRLFTGSNAGRRSDVSGGDKPKLPEKTPSLSQMKRFASGRDTLASFDWTAHQIAPVEFDHSDYYSDEEGVDRFEEEEHEEVIIPFSAPMTVGGGVDLLPRKEINLWKKRTINPPSPLQLRSNMARGN